MPLMRQAPTVHRTPITGRPATLAACAVLAVILNAGAIGLAAEASSPRWDAVAAPVSEKPRFVAMLLVAAPEAVATTRAASRDTAHAVTSPPSAQRQKPASPPTARTTPSPPVEEPAQQVMFYTFREVDDPAFPETNWNLDVDTLDQIGVQRLVFEVLISDRGEVVGCTVFEPSNLANDVKRDLEKRLSETGVLPALRAGQLVASVRRIELLVASTLPDLRADPPAHRP